MDREALTFGDVRTFYFLVVGFLGSTFLAWANKHDNFLMEGNGGGRTLKTTWIPYFLAHSNCSPKFHRLVIGDALFQILESLL